MRIGIALVAAVMAAAAMGREKLKQALPVYGDDSATASLAAAAPLATASISTSLPASAIDALPPMVLNDLHKIAESQILPAAIVEELVALSSVTGLPLQVIADIVRLASTSRLPPAIISAIIALSSAPGIPPQVIAGIVRLASTPGLPPAIISATIALARADALTENELVEYAMLLESNGIAPSDQAVFAALKAIAPRLKSRFDLLSPVQFSRLWAIKMKALEKEAKGENTDELWKVYWDLFLKSCYHD